MTRQTPLAFLPGAGTSVAGAILFLSILNQGVFAQITNVSYATTSTQAILSYTAPDPSVHCTIDVREAGSSTPVHDVDTQIFPNSNIDDPAYRPGTLFNGRSRVVVLGKRAAEPGVSNKYYSRALQAYTQHTFSIQCGTASSTGSFQTSNVPTGMSYNDPLPADWRQPGQYAWPEVTWGAHEWIVDPLTGIRMKMLDGPRNSFTYFSGNFASATALTGTGWTGLSNLLTDDSAAATYSGTTSDWVRLELGTKLYQATVHGTNAQMVNQLVPTLNAYCSSANCATASADDRTIEFCISSDGVRCSTTQPYVSVVLSSCATNCTGSAYRFDAIANPTPMFAEWYPNAKPTIDTTSLTTRSGTVNRAGSVVTLTGGDLFSFDWHAGSQIVVNGTPYTIQSVDNEQQITLSGSPAGSDSGATYSASNAYIFVRKKTSSTHAISIQFAKFTFELGNTPFWEASGDQTGFTNCSVTPVAGPQNEMGWHCHIGGVLYWIGGTSGTVNRLGRAYAVSPTGSPDPWGYGDLGGVFWDNINPNFFYGLILAQSGDVMVLKITYQGDNSDAGDVGAYQALAAPNWVVQNITPPSQGKGLSSLMAAFHPEWNRSHFRTSAFQFLGITPTSNKLVFVLYRDTATNDIEAFYGVLDPLTGSVVAACPSWAYFPARWGSIHGASPMGDPSYIFLAVTFNRGPGTGTDSAGRGPYQSQILSGPIPKTLAQACPAQPPNSTVPNWPMGNQCITVTVDGEPTDPTPGTYTDGKITTQGTSVTGIGTAWTRVMDQTQMLISGTLYLFTYLSPTSGTLNVAPPPQNNASYTIFTQYVNSSLRGYLQDAKEQDTFCMVQDPNSGCPGGYYAGEFFRLIVKNGNTWTLQRGWGGGGTTPPPYYDYGLQGQTTYLVAYPSSCSYFTDGVYACNKSSPFWNFQQDPYGYNTTRQTILTDNLGTGAGHATRGYGAFVDASISNCPTRDGLNNGCYDARVGVMPDVLQSSHNILNQNPLFNQFVGEGQPNAVDSHPSHTQIVVSPKDVTWFTDARPFLGDDTLTGSPANPGQLVSGTLYRFTAAQLPRLRPRSMPTMASCGYNPLLDASGPASVLDPGPNGNYKYCYALKAGECASGSAAGDLYVNCPRVHYPRCTYPGIGNYGGEVQDICVSDLGAYTNNAVQISAARQDPVGFSGRRITSALNRYHWVDQFWNVKTTPDGKFLFTRTTFLQGQRNSVLMAQLPPFPHDQPIDNPNHGAYIPVKIQVTPVSSKVASATVEFGYTIDFHCTSRSETCVKGSDPSPEFLFASEHPTPVSCATGCVITVPAIPQRILYTRVVQRDASGAVVYASFPEARAIPSIIQKP